MIRKKNHIIYRQLSIEEVLPHIGKSNHKFWSNSHNRYVEVRCAGIRNLLWLKGTDCVCCNLKGTHFLIESAGLWNPHLNLYSDKILLTADHITPKSLGGETNLENLQVLCAHCNTMKGNKIISLEDLRSLAIC